MKAFRLKKGVVIPLKYAEERGAIGHGGIFGAACAQPDPVITGWICSLRKGHKGKHASWGYSDRYCGNVW